MLIEQVQSLIEGQLQGTVHFYGGNLVTWRSKKHNVVIKSNAKAEFRSMKQGVCEILWLKKGCKRA